VPERCEGRAGFEGERGTTQEEESKTEEKRNGNYEEGSTIARLARYRGEECTVEKVTERRIGPERMSQFARGH